MILKHPIVKSNESAQKIVSNWEDQVKKVKHLMKLAQARHSKYLNQKFLNEIRTRYFGYTLNTAFEAETSVYRGVSKARTKVCRTFQDSGTYRQGCLSFGDSRSLETTKCIEYLLIQGVPYR